MLDDATRSAEGHGETRTLVVVDGDTVRTLALPARGGLTVGRAEGCEVQSSAGALSRTHARVIVEGGATYVEDLGSRNGTRVRGSRVAPHERVRVSPGDLVECGELSLFVRGEQSASGADVGFVVGPEARWFAPDGGQRIELGRRGALRLVLQRLVEARLASPGRGLSAAELFEAGWPGERIKHESATARVYTTVQRLRGLGFGAALVTHDDGYLLAPEADVRKV